MTARDKLFLPVQMQNYQPANLHALPHATVDRTFLVNMDYTVNQDIVDGEGNILYPKVLPSIPWTTSPFPAAWW